ncbi:MAG: hypothetical protein ABI614_28720 [Planctomycetota bacterium]
MQTTRMQDQCSATTSQPAVRTLDHSFFWGVWHNTDADAQGIVRVVFDDNAGLLRMRVFGAGEPEAIDWREVEADVFADNVDSTEGTKFAAVYDFDFMQVRMHGWVKLGVLVIAVFNRFTDGSGRSSYFDREFFFAIEQA